MSKWCPSCERELKETAFGRNETLSDGLAAYCKGCYARKIKESRIRTGRVKAGRGVGRPRGRTKGGVGDGQG
jgi:hypothetical protein